MRNSDRVLDCLIVGGGPAGLTAAIYLARFRRNCRLIDAGQSRAALIPATHNYPGFASIDGQALLARLREQAEEQGACLTSGRVESVRHLGSDGFVAHTTDGEVMARTLLLATGLIDGAPPMKDLFREGYAGPVRFCPICDGFEALDKRVGILGPIGVAARKAQFMRTYTKEVLLFPTEPGAMAATETVKELQDAGVHLAEAARAVTREGQTVIVETRDGHRHELDVLYPALGCQVNSQLAASLGVHCDSMGMIRVDAHQRTGVKGLYAAGDVVTDLHQISVATAHAAIATTDIHNCLAPNPR